MSARYGGVDGETADGVDVFVFNADGKVIKQQSTSDTAMLERAFGSKMGRSLLAAAAQVEHSGPDVRDDCLHERPGVTLAGGGPDQAAAPVRPAP